MATVGAADDGVVAGPSTPIAAAVESSLTGASCDILVEGMGCSFAGAGGG